MPEYYGGALDIVEAATGTLLARLSPSQRAPSS